MSNRLALLLILVAIGCGDRRDTPSPPPAAPATEHGGFQLRIDASGLPGVPAPIRVTGDTAGVEVRIRRAAAPIELFESWFLPVAPTTPPPHWVDAGVIRLDGETEPAWPVLAPGLHLVVASRGDEQRSGLLPITDLDLIIRQSGDEVLVFVVDSKTGAALPGARVSIFGTDERRTGRADAQGVFRAAIRPGPEVRVIAFSGERIGVGSQIRPPDREVEDLSILETAGDECAPGEEMAFAGVLRTRMNGRIRPGSAEAGHYELHDATGRLLSAGEVELGRAGTFSGACYLPRTVRDGRITLIVTIGDRAMTRIIRARRPFCAPFTVEVLAESEGTAEGSRFPFRIRGLRADGTPLAGATAKYVARRDGRPILNGEGVLAADGELRSSLVLAARGEYELQAEVTGPDEQVRTGSLRFGVRADAAAGIEVIPQSRLIEEGEEAAIRIVAEAGGPVVGRLEDGEVAHPFRIEAGEREAVVRFFPTEPGRHPLVATAKDGNGRQLRARDELWVLDDLLLAAPDEIVLVADRDEAGPGETVPLLLLRPSKLSGCSILQTTEGRVLGAHRVGTTFTSRELVLLRVPDGLGDEIHHRVFAIRDGVRYSAEVTLRVRVPRDRLDVQLLPSDNHRTVAAEVREGDGQRFPALVLFKTDRALSAWLRTDPDGRTDRWDLPTGPAATLEALAVGTDGRIGRARMALKARPGARPAGRALVDSPWPGRISTDQFELPPRTTERWIILPEGEELTGVAVTVHLHATPRSKLYPALADLSGWPAGSTLRALPPLLALAAANAFTKDEQLPPASLSSVAEEAPHALADLLHLRRDDGTWGHFRGDAQDPRLTRLVVGTINASGLLEEKLLGEGAAAADPDRPPHTALDRAEQALALISRMPAPPSAGADESLVRVRVNNAIAGTVRLSPGEPDREYGFLRLPRESLRPGSNLVQLSVAGGPGVTGALTIERRPAAVSGKGPFTLSRNIEPAGPVARGSRLTVRLKLAADRPLRRVFVHCPIPEGAALAGWPELPDGVSFEERRGAIDLTIREVDGSFELTLPLVVLRQGAFDVARARALLLEDPDRRAQSDGETLLFR